MYEVSMLKICKSRINTMVTLYMLREVPIALGKNMISVYK